MNNVMQKIKNYQSEILIFLGFFIFYCITITQNYSLSHDSTYYLNDIEYGPWIFHPHHLLFHIVSKSWMNLLNFIPFVNSVDIAYKIGSMNAIFGALILATLFRFAKMKLKYSAFYSYSLILIIGLSFAFWYYSGCTEVYIIPLYFIIKSMISLFDFNEGNASLNKAIVFISLATLFHQSNIILFGTLFLYILFFHREGLVKKVLTGLGISFLIIGLPYLFAGIIYYENYSLHQYTHWLFLYSEELPEHWSKFNKSMIINDAVGFTRTFYSTYFLYSIDSIKNFLLSAFKDKWLGEEIFLTRNMGNTLGMINLVSVVVVFINYIVFVLKNWKNAKSNFIKNKSILTIALFYFFSLSLFFNFWASSNLEFWIPQNLLFWFITIAIFRNEEIKINKLFISIFIVLNFTINFFGGIYYSMDKHNDLYYNQISGILNENKSNNLVITPFRFVMWDYLTRYKLTNNFSIEAHYFNSKDFAKIKIQLDSAIEKNQSEYFFATCDLTNLDSNKYTGEFSNFIKGYFNNNVFELTKVNPNQINEYYKLKKRKII